MEADDYYFGPTFLRGKPGQRVRLRIENESSTLHNITIPALRIDRDIPPNGKAEVEVTFPRAGNVPSATGARGYRVLGALTPGSSAR